MTVKTAQARINLANIIESLLGYPVTKVPNNDTSPSSEQSYNTKGQVKPQYHINSEHPFADSRKAKTRFTGY